MRPLLIGVLLAAAVIVPAAALGQAVTDQWNSVALPEAPAVKAVTVNPKTTALIVMDFNKQSCTSERRPRCVADLPQVQKILDEARAHGLFVIHTLVAGTTVADMLAVIAPKGTEQAYNAPPDKFLGESVDLQKALKDHGVTTLIAVGTLANGAVLYTASSAVFHGFKAIVPVDGMPGESAFAEALTAWQLRTASP
jgi:nicotinamidase-related amidase